MLEKILVDCIISVITFIVLNWVFNRKENKNEKVPYMYIELLNNVRLKKIHQLNTSDRIICFFRKFETNLNSTVIFEQVTVEQLEEKIRENKYMIYGFENLGCNSIQITHFVYGNGTIVYTDNKVVPSFICKDCKCCFVCPESDAPSSMMGQYMNYPIKYVVEGKTSGISKPYIKNKRKLRRDR